MTTDTCPVCGMNVDDQKTAAKSTFEGKTYSFCCADCKAVFDAHPYEYALPKAS